jgi:hypothetical protein
MNKIDRLSRMRKTILWGVLAGALIAFALLLYPMVSSAGRHLRLSVGNISYPYYYLAFLIWLLTLAVFVVVFMLYKKKLRKNPELSLAINDERVKLNWLKAYRFGFYAVIGVVVLWKAANIALDPYLLGRVGLPDASWFVLSAGVLSLISSFLYYNRDIEDE